jgi:Predicted integral membrane protein
MLSSGAASVNGHVPSPPQVVERVNGTVLWGNLHLLFWLSLFPVTTAWVAERTFARTPVIVYGVNLLLAAVAYYVLQLAIFHVEGGSGLRQALGRDLKGKVSPLLYISGIALAFVTAWLAVLVFTSVASSGSCPTDAWSGTSPRRRKGSPRTDVPAEIRIHGGRTTC